MPQLADITNQDLSSYVHTSSVNSAAVPPTVPATNMEPGLNKYLRCPLPPVWQSSPDSIRQFYNNNQVPQVRIFNPSTPQNVAPVATTPVATPVTKITQVINTTSSPATGYTSGSNSNGYWQKDPTGLIRQWGTTPAFGTGSNNAQQAVTFPNTGLFTSTPSVFVSPSTSPTGSDPQDGITCYSVGKSTSGFTTTVTAVVTIGGSGASGVNNVKVDWFAIGY